MGGEALVHDSMPWPCLVNVMLQKVHTEGCFIKKDITDLEKCNEKDQRHSVEGRKSAIQKEMLKDYDFNMKAKVEMEILLKSIKS